MRTTATGLAGFASRNGYTLVTCPDCRGGAARVRASGGGEVVCANCGGSGRLWQSRHGSLSDAGLERLRALVRTAG